MSWTKQHFELIAQVLNNKLPANSGRAYDSLHEEQAVDEVIDDLCDEFKNILSHLNPNFNSQRFEDSVFKERTSK